MSDIPSVSQAVVDPPVTTTAPQDPSTSDPAPLSKKAQKRAAKEAKYAATKLERRAREKEAKKEKKRLKAEKRAAGELDEDADNDEQARKPKKRKLAFGGRVVVDLGFDELMNIKEVKSLGSQLAYTYSSNKNASFPFELIFCSLNGKTKERLDSLENAGYKRWTKTEWWEEGFERLWSAHAPAADQTAPDAPPQTEDPQGSAADARQKVVYLTADSEEELTELKPDETYIIGGIVDHNRYKNLCLNKANEHGVRTAKLPIGRYLASMPTRKVLTVNQCFEILVKWVETKDWEEALYSVIPQRKFLKDDGKPILIGGNVVEVPKEEDDESEVAEGDGAAASLSGKEEEEGDKRQC